MPAKDVGPRTEAESKRSASVLGLRSFLGPLSASLIIAAALKAALLLAGVVPFNADEAVVALMARHILQGARPVFFYGQAYMGSLDAWLIAGAFAVLGQSVAAIRIVQSLLYMGTIATTYALGMTVYGSRWVAGAATLLLAVPVVSFSLYTTASLGGYGEMLLIGNVVLLLALRLAEGEKRWWVWALFGVLSGLGFWGFPLVGVYVLPAAVFLWLKRRRSLRDWGIAAAGFAVGAMPWWWATLSPGSETLAEVSGSAIAGASTAQPLAAIGQHAFNLLLFGTTVTWGLRPPWSAQLLALPLIPFALTVNAAVLVFVFRTRGEARGHGLLLGVCATLMAAFVLTPFGADPSGRYFLPLAAPLALFGARMLEREFRRKAGNWKWLGNGIVLGLVAFNVWGTAQSAASHPPGITTQFDAVAQVDHRYDAALIQFLRERGETRGYTNYWVEFPLAFLSDEELIFSARLPYHLDFRYTARDDRYPPYSRAVDESPRAAYITTRHPALDERIRDGLNALGVHFFETRIGDYHVFHNLSRKVTPGELGL